MGKNTENVDLYEEEGTGLDEAAATDDDPYTHTLRTPVPHKGHTYTFLTMREPAVKDQINAKRQTSSDEDFEVRLFANLCEVPSAVIADMKMYDYKRIQSIYQRFLD